VSEERLQKILARAGLASRRQAEELIRQGRVTVNGQVAAIGDKADLVRDAVKLDGKRIHVTDKHRYLLLNKPRGVMSTVSDPAGRPTVIDLVPPALRRALVPVGRLDFNSEGLLLLTDDGELAQQVAHPRYGCWKTYEVKVKGQPSEAQIHLLRGGISLQGRRTAPCRIAPRHTGRATGVRTTTTTTTTKAGQGPGRSDKTGQGPGRSDKTGQGPGRSDKAGQGPRGRSAKAGQGPGRSDKAGQGPGRSDKTGQGPRDRSDKTGQGPRFRSDTAGRFAASGESNSWWIVELGEGRTRQIREMFLRIGHPVQKLRRVAIGPVSDPGLALGAVRELTDREVTQLRKTARPAPSTPPPLATSRPRREASVETPRGRSSRGPSAGTSQRPSKRATTARGSRQPSPPAAGERSRKGRKSPLGGGERAARSRAQRRPGTRRGR
jgi:pseudouridine synthase